MNSPSQSPFWQSLKRHKGRTRTDGSGRYYEWDYTHGDIEVYDSRGNHLGSARPDTGALYKPPVPGRKITL